VKKVSVPKIQVNLQVNHRVIEKKTSGDWVHAFPKENRVVPSLNVHGNGGVGLVGMTPEGATVLINECKFELGHPIEVDPVYRNFARI